MNTPQPSAPVPFKTFVGPKIAVIILNWNGKRDTLDCLDSARQIDYPNYQVVVVDNGSSDDSVQAIRQAHPKAMVLETGANLGYAGGNNVGIRWALEQGFEGILLLNNDTIVDPGLLSAFAEAETRFPGAGVFGAKIYYFSPSDVLWFAGGTWQPESMGFKHIGLGKQDGPAYSEARAFDYMTGCALYASANVYRDIGLLDEAFFLTFEETDWCYRARKRGYQCMFIPEAKLWHKVSASFGGNSSPLHNYFMVRNKLLWARRHLPWRAFLRLQVKMLGSLSQSLIPTFFLASGHHSFIKRWLWSIASWRAGFKRRLADATNRSSMYGLRDFYLGRFGDCPQQVRDLRSSNKTMATSSE